MSDDRAALLDRAEFLRSDWNRSVDLQMRIVDWRSALAWAAFAGALALAVMLTESSPVAWVVVAIVAAGAVGFGILSRRRVRRRVAELLATAQDDARRLSETDPAAWDRSRLTSMPSYYLQPADVASPAQLEHLLRLSPETLKEQFAELRSAMLTIVLFFALCAAGIILAAIALVSWLLGSILDDFAMTQDPLPMLAAVLAAIALAMPQLEAAAMSRAMRVVAGHLATAAARELPRLWNADPQFTTGEVIRWTPTGYVIDATRMTLPPVEPASNRSRRILLVVLGGVMAVLLLALVFFDRVFKPFVETLTA